MKHRQKDGTYIALKDMSDLHLQRTINLFEQKAQEGITIRQGGGVDMLEMWYDEYTATGEEARRVMKIDKYIEEFKSRF